MKSDQPKGTSLLGKLALLLLLAALFGGGVGAAKYLDKVNADKGSKLSSQDVSPTPTLKVNYKQEVAGVTEEGTITPTTKPVQTTIPTPTAVVTAKPTLIPTSTNSSSNDPAYMKVDKYTSIGSFAPSDLVSFPGSDQQVSSRIVSDLTNLMNAAKKDGLTFRVASGYRSYASQVSTFDYWVNQELQKNPSLTRAQAEELANKYSARPGHSEHQLGTTVDILAQDTNYQFVSESTTQSAKWLEANAGKYKFKISFKQGNPEYNYEPWHIRWYPN